MRVLLVSQYYPPAGGGAEIMARRLTSAWRDAGHHVSVLTTTAGDRRATISPIETHDGAAIHRLAVRPWRWLGTLLALRAIDAWMSQRARDFDVVCAIMLKHAAHAALGAGLRHGLPVVARAEGAGVTGDVAWQRSALCGGRIARRCRRARAIIAPSSAIGAELRAFGYSPDRIEIIPNGVPIPADPWQRGATARFRRQLDLPEAPTFCYTGRLQADKGLTDALHALARLPPTEPYRAAPRLVFVGAGPHREELEALAARLEIAPRVTFAGQRADVDPFLRAADAFVLPSYQEGMSLSLLEALALGMPSVVSAIPSHDELAVALGASAFQRAPPRDPPALARSLRAALNAPQAPLDSTRATVAAQFGIDTVARRHLELFARAMD